MDREHWEGDARIVSLGATGLLPLRWADLTNTLETLPPTSAGKTVG